jgi:hypothetical protein
LKKYIFAAVACLATMAFVVPAASAQNIGGCQLQGTASFSPGLTNNSQAFSYSFGGNLSNCQSSQSGVPLSGTEGAGQILNEQVVNSTTGQTVTQAYQEPTPTGSGSCGSSTTSGQALTTWADGSTTVVSYTTTGAAALVQLSGSVQPSMTLTAVNPPAGVPTTFTINTTRYAGDSAGGVLTFQPPDPTACATSTGVTTAAISGSIGLEG